MNREQLTEAILAKGVEAGFEPVTVGPSKNPVFWRKPDGAIECVFNIQRRDIAVKGDEYAHLRAAVKRFDGFPDAGKRVLALFADNPDGTPINDGLIETAGWIKGNVQGGSKRVEVWAELTKKFA